MASTSHRNSAFDDEKPRVVTRAQLPSPRPLSKDDFDAICDTSRIPPAKRKRFRTELDAHIALFVEPAARREPTRQTDAKHIRAVLNDISRAVRRLEFQYGKSGQHALADAALTFAPMLSVDWLRDRHSGQNLESNSYRYIRKLARLRRGEDPLRHVPELLLRYEPADLIRAVLGQIESGLAAAVDAQQRQREAKGGRKRLILREAMITGLALIWLEQGQIIVRSRKSDFAAFVEGVFEAIGWPTEGAASSAIEISGRIRILP